MSRISSLDGDGQGGAAVASPESGGDPARLPLREIVVYTLPAVGAGYLFFLVTLFMLKYATDVLLISPAAVGAIFMAARIWDAITDPLAGYWSDRTRTRLGRRRPWLLASAIPAGLTFVMMWSPPVGLSGGAQVAWLAAAVFLFYSAMTAMIVPHTSLGAELTTHYHDRTRVFGVRQVAWHVGIFAALACMAALTNASEPRALASTQAWTAGVVMAVLSVVAVIGIRERPEFQGRGSQSPYRAFGDVLRNPHARLLLVVFLIESTGGATVGALTIYFSEYVLETPRLTTLYIAAYFLVATLSVPMWIRLSRRTGKKRLWFASMIGTALFFGATFLLGPGDSWQLMLLASLLGLAAGCGNIVGPSIQADVIDFDEYHTGERKEGSYFAAWNFVFKLATGLMLGITGFVLQASGFVPNAEQTETVRLAIRSLYALFPLCCYGLGALLFLRFRFNEAEYAQVRQALDVRARGAD